MKLDTTFSPSTASEAPHPLQKLWGLGVQALNLLQPLCLLAARLYVARVFFLSGLTKIRDWDTTLLLFSDDYRVPLLSPAVAAVMGTAGELGLPVLLALGLFGRFGALGLSVVNVMAVLSLPDMPEPAFMLHVFWGSLLLLVAAFGPGRFSLDAWSLRRWLRLY
jgi:putative oxidoreductase